MDASKFRLSDNVEIDCLGKDTNAKSQEASAAIACQDEVHDMRERFVQHGMREQLRDGKLTMTSGRERIEASSNDFKNAFDDMTLRYATAKENDFANPNPDTYQSRVREFARTQDNELHFDNLFAKAQ